MATTTTTTITTTITVRRALIMLGYMDGWQVVVMAVAEVEEEEAVVVQTTGPLTILTMQQLLEVSWRPMLQQLPMDLQILLVMVPMALLTGGPVGTMLGIEFSLQRFLSVCFFLVLWCDV